MFWIRSDLEVLQVPVNSADVTAVVLRLPDRSIFMSTLFVTKREADRSIFCIAGYSGTVLERLAMTPPLCGPAEQVTPTRIGPCYDREGSKKQFCQVRSKLCPNSVYMT
jgi:hypothetical protein